MNFRKLCVESLEERALLAVVAGGFEQAAELAMPTEATTWVVNTLDDPTSWDTGDDVTSLREAIGRAETGDTIVFDDSLAGGTITLNGSQLSINKGVTIDARSIDGITIDANGKSRVFSISGGDESNPVELVSLTISGGEVQGSDANGGGLYNSGTLMIVNSMITGNTCVSSSDYHCSSVGGGIYNDSGTLTITNTTISQNTVYSSSSSSEFFSVSFGGGIYNDSGTLTITDTTISENTTYSSSSSSEYLCSSCGGGISNSGMLTITNSAISGNTSSSSSSEYLCSSRGGGISNTGTLTMTNSDISGNTSFSASKSYIDSGGGGLYNSGTLTITNCTVSGNTSSPPSSCYNGGGILNNSGTLTITGSMISGNSAGYAGGGIHNDYNGTLTVTNSTISGNTANYGGGINDYDGVLTVTNSMILENIAKYGGGIYNDDNGVLTVTNSTISGNTANSGSGITNGVGPVKLYNTIIVQNSTDTGNDEIRSFGSSIYAYNSLSTFIDWTESDECIVYDPTRPLFTDFENRDYTLDVGSQAINKGNNDYVTTETDLAGNARIVAEIVDLGAYEYQPETPSTIVTTLNDVVDETDELISLREAVTLYAEEGDTITFVPELAGGTIVLGGIEIEIRKGITIDASAIGGITIDANGESRIFYVEVNSADSLVELNCLTLTGGYSPNGSGGAICNRTNGTLVITNSVISGNSTGGSGGAIYSDSLGTLTVTNSVLSGNSARYGGGLYNNYFGTLNITNCTIAGNSADRNNGGLYNYYGTLYLNNSIVALNYSGGDNEIRQYGGDRIYSNNSIIGFDPGFVVAPVFESGKLINLDEIDLSLTSESWGIDRGDNTFIEIETDVTGNPRIIASWNGDATADIGAYEYQERVGKEVEAPSLTVTTTLDVIDDTDGLISLREAIIYAGPGDTVTFDSSLANKTITLNGSEIILDKAVCIEASGIGAIVIDAHEQSRVFNEMAGSGKLPVSFVNLIITGGRTKGVGGGIYVSGTSVIMNSVIIANSASSGGGVYSDFGGAMTISNSAFLENYANNNGGGIYNYGNLSMTNSVVSENSADTGGGIYDDYYSRSDVTNVEISGNSARSGGGIYNADWSKLNVVNCSISGNAANSYGGIYNDDGSVNILNSIVSFNYANAHEDIYNNTGTISEYNCVIGTDPCFTVAPLFDESGNLTNFDELNLTLSPASSAINAGDNDYVTTETDLAGNPRIVGDIVDIGAYEFPGTILEAPSILTGTKNIFVSCGANRHRIVSNEIENASGYELAYSTDGGNSWILIQSVTPSVIVTGLTYGNDITYRIRALGQGLFANSDWSAEKTFNVCPMDINNDGDIGGFDRSLMASAWGTEEGDENYRYYADINGDGDLTGFDRNLLSSNWGLESDDEDLLYPRPRAAADTVFAAYESGDIEVDLNIF